MIVESPNKVRKIRDILGAGWDVAASVGHIRDLPLKELGIAMPGYQPQYELSGRGADVVKTLRARVAKAETVYLATDPDREGEAIAWHLAEALKLKRALRVSFDAITPDVIARAIAAPRSVDRHLVHAQEARRVLDRLVGYQVSPVLSRQAARSGLSAGRVQSPAVRLVVDRDREIEAFVEVRHFGAELSFDRNSWRAQWETAPFLKSAGNDATEPGKYILDEALAARAAACRDCTVLASSNRIAKQPPPPPFTTSTMLQAASVQLHWKPDVTAQVAQRLFEAGLITYHRTDSQNFSAEALKEVRGYAKQRGLPLPASARSFRARGNAQEAHEAIRPTHFATEQAGEDHAQQQLYRLIWLRAVASQLADAEWSVNTTRLSARNGQETFTFKAEGRTLVLPGWKTLTAKDDADEEDANQDESCGKVPVLTAGASLRAEEGRVLHKKTQPPPRYTQASLIKKLESIGIGRPSTYPAILKNVQTRGYLEDDRKYLRPTELGLLVVDALVTRFSFVEYEFTRALEQQLDDIAEGKAEYLAVVSAADERLQRELLALRSTPRAHPPTGSPIWRPASTPAHASWSQREPATTASAGSPRASARTKSRKGTRSGDLHSPDGATAARSAARARTKRTSGPASVKDSSAPAPRSRTTRATSVTAPGTNSAQTLAEPAAKRASAAGAGPSPCPVCKAGFVRLLKEDAKFYGCSAYSETGCRFMVWRTIAGRTVREEDVSALCRDGHTGKLNGFTSKAGRPFEAALVLNAEGKVEFSFQPRV